MNSEVKKYFRHLDLVREDMREELALIDLPEKALTICDYGCGNGLTTYSLGLEVPGSKCIGVDRFDGESFPTLSTMMQYLEIIKSHCKDHTPTGKSFSDDLCRLIGEKRNPQFRRGDIVSGQNLPQGVDLAYCKRLLINIFHGKHGNELHGEDGLRAAINHIVNSLRPGGLVCVIEFEGFGLEEYFLREKLRILNRTLIKRNDIRSRGRTTVTSHYDFYLCQKS